MKIRFGHDLDHASPYPIKPAMGVKAVGPLGFLSILETQFGIATVSESPATRIIQYQGCLEASDTEQRFFHHSLQVDSFNVAKSLLDWRDTWYEAGWKGWFTDGVSLRLRDMADIEQLAISRVNPGFGQRLQRVLALLKTQSTQIEQVELLRPLADFSSLWQQILQHFSYVEVESSFPMNMDSTESDLQRVQRTLQTLNSGELEKESNGVLRKSRLFGDNSFVVFKSRSKALSAEVLSQWLGQSNNDQLPIEIAVLATQDGVILDDALAMADLPRLGFEQASPWRPVLQVLPIALDLLWEPLNFEAFLQFLLHPIGPLTSRIRQPLARVVAELPGMGGKKWQQTLQDLLTKEQEREDFEPKRFQQLKQDLSYWFDSPRYLSEQGLPIDVAIERIRRVIRWLGEQQARWDDEAMCALFGAGFGQASQLLAALENRLADGATVIAPEALRHLLSQLTGVGTPMVDRFAECLPGRAPHIHAAIDPDSFYHPIDTVIWWNLQASPTTSRYPWSNSELQQLAEQGLTLPDIERLLQRRAASWHKPITAAQKQCVLVLHDSDEAHHPLWDQLQSCLSGWQEVTLDDVLQSGDALPTFLNIHTYLADHKPLPSLQRWWQLPSGDDLKARQQESFSSLDSFFYSPYQWVLRYKAKLQPGALQSLSDGNRLKGSLLHHLYERFFNENPAALTSATLDAEAIHDWLNTTFSQLLTEEGAVLLQPGRLVEREQLLATARQSLLALLQQLRAAQIVQVQMELPQNAQCFAGALTGFIDMTVINQNQQEAVIDIKWGGAKYRKASLKDNTHLQLLTYAYLRHRNLHSQAWPALAYFIIENGQLLAQNQDYFPNAIAVNPDNLENSAQGWERMRQTWLWRRDQLDQGLIELTVTGTEPDEQSNPGEDALVIPATNDGFNDFAVLTGWSASA